MFQQITNFAATMQEVLDILFWGLLSAVKFLFAAGGLLIKSHRPWYLDLIITTVGGCVGVVVFTYLGAIISKYFERFHLFRIKYKTLKKLVRIMHGYGLLGIAFISPMTISIPVGCIISASFEHDKKRIIRVQIASVIFWSVLLFGLKGMFNINLGNKL
jgi:membrane protein YqaA with SNARE-associated domain